MNGEMIFVLGGGWDSLFVSIVVMWNLLLTCVAKIGGNLLKLWVTSGLYPEHEF